MTVLEIVRDLLLFNTSDHVSIVVIDGEAKFFVDNEELEIPKACSCVSCMKIRETLPDFEVKF